jgi:hypothetical protein
VPVASTATVIVGKGEAVGVALLRGNLVWLGVIVGLDVTVRLGAAVGLGVAVTLAVAVVVDASAAATGETLLANNSHRYKKENKTAKKRIRFILMIS